METSTANQDRHYDITTEPLTGLVKATRDGTVLAASTRAKVMYETRIKPVVYFPIEDVTVQLSDRTALQTFCPFKGTARYRDVQLPGMTLGDAVWSYERPFSECHDIEGYVGFMPNTVTEIDLGGNRLRPDVSGSAGRSLVDWLLKEASSFESPETFTAALGRKLQDHGGSISRLSVMIWSLHPMIAGKNYIWERETDGVTTLAPSYEIHSHPGFINSPLHKVSGGSGGFRQKLDGNLDPAEYPIVQDLKDKGATDYVAMPLTFSDGQINVLTLASDRPSGFTTSQLGLIFECAAVIGRFYEVFTQRENAKSLLETYVGKRSGARVLDGEIRRGQGDEIDAAIMFCDLRNSTHYVENLSRPEYMELINEFFSSVSLIIDNNGGEVLKFIGDAVLAIFPASEDYSAACRKVLASARQIVAEINDKAPVETKRNIKCSIGIAYGDVTYGNVGSCERLDFTVIGQAANVAARLCDFGKDQGHEILASHEVVCSDHAKADLGRIALRNLSEPTHIFAVKMP